MGSILYLPMNRKWFNLVYSGEKKEEYRLFKPHWATRIRRWIDSNSPDNIVTHLTPDYGAEISILMESNGKNLPICFFNGYHKNAPKFNAMCSRVELRKESLHPEWGEDAYNGELHFVLHIGQVEKGEKK